MSVLVGYLMQHGLVNGPDEMNMIQSPYFGGPVKLQNLLHLTEQNGGRDGYFLLYKCFCESRQENPLGHGDVVEALERYGKLELSGIVLTCTIKELSKVRKAKRCSNRALPRLA